MKIIINSLILSILSLTSIPQIEDYKLQIKEKRLEMKLDIRKHYQGVKNDYTRRKR